MSFSLSAGVNVVEKDFTTIVPAVSSSTGAFAGAFAWGPILDPQLISSENDLVATFGKPNVKNYKSFFSAANFLGYTNALYVARVDSDGRNAVAEPSGSVTSVTPGTGQTSIYNYGYTITFETSPNGQTATGTVNIAPTTLANTCTMSNVGIGYDGAPKVTLVPTNGGVGATAHCTVDGAGHIATLVIDTPGTGYTTAPTVVLTTNSGGINGACHVTLSGTTVLAGVVDTPGTGYVTSVPVVTITGGGGINATATATISGTGTISGIVVTGAGTGFTSPPNITVTGAGIGATVNVGNLTATTIASIGMILNGNGYRIAPTATIKDQNGGSVTQPPNMIVNMLYEGVDGLLNAHSYDTSFSQGLRTYGEFCAKWAGSLGNAIGISCADKNSYALLPGGLWEFHGEFDAAPGTSEYVAGQSGADDEMHIVVIDRSGAITGVPGTILEKFAYVSKASDAKLADGTNNYYVDVLNSRSKYVWWLTHPVAADMVGAATPNWGNAALSTIFTKLDIEFTYRFSDGLDGVSGQEYLVSDANQQAAYALYENADIYDVSLIVCGKMSALTAGYVIQNIAEVRKDCIAFCSPQNVDASPIVGDSSVEIAAIVSYRTGVIGNAAPVNALPSSSYGVVDSGYKYQYDRYNDKYWWIPLNADTAGLCARTDYTNDPWFSPGGFNRGQIKNVVKLAHNPNKTARDQLYKNGINPIVSFPGQGTVLFGDKTLLAKPSAFDRINVRRLFIVLEKAIATAAKYTLFELNDSFTRMQFKSMVEPFLRDVQGRRGIIDFRVKCDESNNTGEVIDRNEFAGDIFIKPARAINYINLSFVAARTAVSFNEIGA